MRSFVPLMLAFSLLSLLALFGLVSCNGAHCISVGGTYEKINGNVKYCWDNTSDAQRPILTDENGKAAVLMSQEDIQQIAAKLEIFTPTNKSVSAQSEILADHVNAILDRIYK